MKYLQADGILLKSNNISLTSNEAKVDHNGTSSTQPYQGRAHYNNYYASSTADIMYLNSPITGAVI